MTIDHDNIPRGVRPPGQNQLFACPSNDPRVVPDRVGPVVEGYFHVPALWIGEKPDDAQVSELNPQVHHAVAYERDLACGIRVRVNRDGLFLFDFTSWAPAAPVVIPGFIAPENPPYQYPVEHNEAERRAEDTAIVRAQIMNAHQACLTTAERMTKNRSAGGGFPVTAWSTHKALTLDTPPPYHDDYDSLHALTQNSVNNKDRVAGRKVKQRRCLEIEVVDNSFKILDLLLADESLMGVRLVEGAFMAANRRREKRYGEAITLGWTVCEQLISLAWGRMLDDVRVSDSIRLPKDRRKKLTGRDYTASVMVEMLELNGRLDHEIFRMLEVARKARNAWAHEMRIPPEREIYFCFKAIERLLLTLMNIPLVLDGGGRGGVPQWPVWFWKDFKPNG